jgi:hypothetical protein
LDPRYYIFDIINKYIAGETDNYYAKSVEFSSDNSKFNNSLKTIIDPSLGGQGAKYRK